MAAPRRPMTRRTPHAVVTQKTDLRVRLAQDWLGRLRMKSATRSKGFLHANAVVVVDRAMPHV